MAHLLAIYGIFGLFLVFFSWFFDRNRLLDRLKRASQRAFKAANGSAAPAQLPIQVPTETLRLMPDTRQPSKGSCRALPPTVQL